MKKQPPAFYIEVRLRGEGPNWESAFADVERVLARDLPDLKIVARNASIEGEPRMLVRKGGGV